MGPHNPLRNVIAYLSKIYFNIISLFTPGTCKRSTLFYNLAMSLETSVHELCARSIEDASYRP